MDNKPSTPFNQQPEAVWCPECGQVIPLKMLSVHRNRMHNIPLPDAPPRERGKPDSSVPMWVSDKELPPKEPEDSQQAASATDDDAQSGDDLGDIPNHEHDLPEHSHQDYSDILGQHTNDMATLKLAMAQLVTKLQQKDTELANLQGMLDTIVKGVDESDLATAVPVVLFDTEEKKVVGVQLLYKKKRGMNVDSFLKALVDAWHREGRGVEVVGLPPKMAFRVKDDATGRGFDMYPTTMLLTRVSKKDREALKEVLQSGGD